MLRGSRDRADSPLEERLRWWAVLLVRKAAAPHRPALRQFMHGLGRVGLAGETILHHLRIAREFLSWLAPERSPLPAIRRLTGEDIEQFVTDFRHTHEFVTVVRARGALRHLLLVWAKRGWIEPWLAGKVLALRVFDGDPPAAAVQESAADRAWVPSARYAEQVEPRWRRTFVQFREWLQERELSPSTVLLYLRNVRPFMRWLVHEGRASRPFRRLAPRDVERFILSLRHGRTAAAMANIRSALQSFLRFLVALGSAPQDLVDAVPRLVRYRLSRLPKGLAERQVDRALKTAPDDCRSSALSRALLLLLATYGVRCGHIAQLRLQDVDWEERTIRFAPHKGGKAITHRLSAAVAQALAHYVTHFRPQGPFGEFFLRSQRPFIPLDQPAISGAVRRCLARSGISAGPHAFRHAFATRLLRQGQTLKAIADLLGHRELESSTIYAKVAVDDLRRVAAPWPRALR